MPKLNALIVLIAAASFWEPFSVVASPPVRLRRRAAVVYKVDADFLLPDNNDALADVLTLRYLEMSMSMPIIGPAPEACEGFERERSASFPVYATGDIGCDGAEETDNPVGTGFICATGGNTIFYEVQLEGVAEDWSYYIELQQQNEVCLDVVSQVAGFMTDGNGDGIFSATYSAPSGGNYDFNIDVVSDEGVPPDARNREIGGFGYVEINVPG